MTIQEIELITRNIVGDIATSGKDLFTYNAGVATFTLTEDNVLNVSDVSVNGTELNSGQWTYDSEVNKVEILSGVGITSGDTVAIDYTYYPNYASAEVQAYVNAAMVHLSIHHINDWIVRDSIVYPTPEPSEKNLIALIASTLLEPNNISYRLPDVSISVPYISELPTHSKIAKIIAWYKRDSHGVFGIL